MVALRVAEIRLAVPVAGSNPSRSTDPVFFAANSGLAPAYGFSLSDHKRAYFRQTVGAYTDSLSDLERAWLSSKVAVVSTDSNDDLWAKLRALT